ncbi:MAG: dUTP diphosphatase [Treponema sp.]|jgi:dUTP pyrophosphatase|nr:dUTP diphosphatase [Treponema sp.]
MVNRTPEPNIRVLKKNPEARLPQYETEGASGMDLRALLFKELVIPPLGRERIPTGLIMEIPPGYEGQIRPRSGLAARQGITVLNSPGTIDADYRGEVEIILINLGNEPVTIHDGDRIAQLVITPVNRAIILESGLLSETKRGKGGFGSTGV